MIRYQAFEKKYLPQVLELLEPLWGHLSIIEREAYFHWKYLNQPISSTNKLFIALNSKNEVVGFRGYFTLFYEVKNKVYEIISFSDATVKKEYRGKGIFKALTDYSMKKLNSKEILYTTTSNNTWGTSTNYIKIGSIPISEKAIQYRFKSIPCFTNRKYTLELSSTFKSKDFIEFYTNHLNANKIMISRNKAQWEWRYSNPITKYKYIYLWKKQELIGFLSYYKINKYRAFILDYYFNDLNDLKYALNQMRKKDSVFLTQLWSISKSTDDLKTLKKQGFFSLSKISNVLKKESLPPVLVRPGVYEINPNDWEIEGKRITDSKNWNINLICSDGI